MSGISYELSRIKAFILDVDGVLSSSIIAIDEKGKLQRSINVKDVVAVNRAIVENLLVVVISERSERDLGKYLDHFKIDKKLIHLNVKNKKEFFINLLSSYQLKEEEVAFLGSDLADVAVLSSSCFFVAPADASIDILQRANYISDYVGGAGVVRDVVEQVLRAQHKW